MGETAPVNGLMNLGNLARGAFRLARHRRALAWFWEARIALQKEIDASISAKGEFEYLYDKPFLDNSKIRAAGPFTVESLAPYKMPVTDWNDAFDLQEVAESRPDQ